LQETHDFFQIFLTADPTCTLCAVQVNNLQIETDKGNFSRRMIFWSTRQLISKQGAII